MKKLIKISAVVLFISLAMILVGSILRGIAWEPEFDGALMGVAFNNIGYIAFALSGVVLTRVGVLMAAKGDCGCNKDKGQEK